MRWISLKSLHEETGLSVRTLQYIGTQEPGVLVTRVRGKVTEYKQPDCAINLRNRSVAQAVEKETPADFEKARARKEAALAEQEEMKLAKMRGETITIAESIAMFQKWLETVRRRLVGLPGLLAVRMVGLATAAIAMAILEEGVRDVLRATQREAEQMGDDEGDEAEVA